MGVVIVQSKVGAPGADTTAPTISNIIGAAGSGATWDTNEPASSQVEYGASAPTGGATYSTVVLADTPAAYWRLNETSGSVADNAEGTAAYDATYHGTPSLGVAGLLPADSDKACGFTNPALSQYIDASGFDMSGAAYTLEAWVSHTDTFSDFGLIGQINGGFTSGVLVLLHNGDQITLFHDGASVLNYDTAGDIYDGTGHHIVATYDGSDVRLYYDNSLVAGPTAATDPTIAGTFMIGQYGFPTGTYGTATVDECAVWGRAISTSEVGDHWTAAQSGGGTGYTYQTTMDTNLVSHHVVNIPTLAATWHFAVKSQDAAGNLATSADQTVGGGTLTRPWALPTTSGTVNISGSIDDTGATDVTAALQADIDACPNGRIYMFGAGKTYKISHSLNLKGRNNLIIDGNGSTLNHVLNSNLGGLGASYIGSAFFWYWYEVPPTHITFRNFVFTAASPNPGVMQAAEHACFLYAMGGSYLEVDNVTASGIFGQFIALNNSPSYVWVHNNNVINCGANGIAVICGSNVLVEENTFGTIGYCAIDLEPEATSDSGCTYITVRNNSFGTWVNCFLAVNGINSNKVITDLDFNNNTCTGDSLLTLSTYATTSRIQRFSFTDNTSLVAAAGPVLRFAHIDTLTVTGNSQPLTSGSLYSISDCTNVTT